MKRGDYKIHMQSPAYTPNRLLNRVMELCGVKNDAQLAALLHASPSTINRIRSRVNFFGGGIILRMQEVAGLTAQDVIDLLGEYPRGSHK